MGVLYLPAVADILLLHPEDSLQAQIHDWAAHHPERRVEQSTATSVREAGELLGNATAAMIDATADAERAKETLAWTIAAFGADKVVVYTEATHEGLELFVRSRGPQFWLGPYFDEQWEEILDRLLCDRRESSIQRNRRTRRLCAPTRGGWAQRRNLFLKQFGQHDWPMTGTD